MFELYVLQMFLQVW